LLAGLVDREHALFVLGTLLSLAGSDVNYTSALLLDLIRKWLTSKTVGKCTGDAVADDDPQVARQDPGALNLGSGRFLDAVQWHCATGFTTLPRGVGVVARYVGVSLGLGLTFCQSASRLKLVNLPIPSVVF